MAELRLDPSSQIHCKRASPLGARLACGHPQSVFIRSMNRSTNEETSDETLHLSVEEQSRLLDLLCGALGVAGNWTRSLEQQLTTLRRGFTALSSHNSSSRMWAQALETLLLNKPKIAQLGSRQLHPLANLLERQPVQMPREEMLNCLGLASIAIASLVRGTGLSTTFIDGLEQMFRSNRGHWQAVRRSIAFSGALPGHGRLEGMPDAADRFLRSSQVLVAGGLYFPDLTFASGRALDPKGPDVPMSTGNASSLSDHQKTTPERKPTIFSAAQHLKLFEFQMVQQEQEPTLNSYRLTNDWNSLSSSEFRDCLRILVGQLRLQDAAPAARALRLHAACRLLSMMCQLSIEILASLPLGRRGSMHLDLRCSLLRRDLSVLAPRVDRVRGLRWRRRWLRTPLPPEIALVLVDAYSLHPDAKTVGDLMVVHGLTPTVCHRMVNRGRVESRVYESLRIARSLRSFFLEVGIHPSTVSRVLGDVTVIPRAHHYYLLLNQEEVHAAINLWCRHVGLQCVASPAKRTLIGSPRVREFSEISSVFRILTDENHKHRMSVTARTGLDEAIKFHNAFVARYALQLLWGIGGRCQNLSRITVAALFADHELVTISDRASDRYSERRVCVLSNVLKKSRLNYVEHLLSMSGWLMRKEELVGGVALINIARGLDPKALALPILYIQKETDKDPVLTVRAITRADLKKAARSTPISELNEPRHFLITQMDRLEVAAVAVDAQFGHHQAGAPPFGLGSGLSITEFIKYMQGILDHLHIDLGLQELVGLGRRDPARLKLPTIALPDQLPVPDNLFLIQRMAVEDFNPPDILLAEEDCPISEFSLAIRRGLANLLATYKTSAAVAQYPWGSVCFCLIACDVVINFSELEMFFTRLAENGDETIGSLRGVEVFGDGQLPIGQCLLSPLTVDALQVARRKVEPLSYQESLAEMQVLLKALQSSWPNTTGPEAAIRLQTMTMHSAMIDFPAISRFSAFHKGPFIPLADIKRLAKKQPTVITVPVKARQKTARSNDFSEQVSMVRVWANKDMELGEYRRRANGLLADLEHWGHTHSIDDADEYLIDFLRAELGDAPPFQRLSLPVLLEYLGVQIKFFSHARFLGELPKTPDDWADAISIFSDDSGALEGKRRWAGLHIGAWLHRKGFAVPQVLLQGKFAPTNFRPHLSVYITDEELEECIKYLSSTDTRYPSVDWTPVQLRLRRKAALRPAELRYLKAKHLSIDGKILHITTSGHIHLKNVFSRGLVALPQSIRHELLQHRAWRLDSPQGDSAAMFVDASADGYANFDETVHRAQWVLRAISGRQDFRIYDFRASALTDLLVDIPHLLTTLLKGDKTEDVTQNSQWISSRHCRGAMAAREARQASILTSLRYYYLGGPIERRVIMNEFLTRSEPNPTYMAAVQGRTTAALHSEQYRITKGGQKMVKHAHRPASVPKDVSVLSQPNAAGTTLSPQFGDERLILAGLLASSGLTLRASADQAGISYKSVENFNATFSKALAMVGIDSLHSTASDSSSIWFSLLPALSKWAFFHRSDLLKCVSTSPKLWRIHASKLNLKSIDGVTSMAHVLAGLPSMGIQPLIYFAQTVSLTERVTARRKCEAIGVNVVPDALSRQVFAAIRFCLARTNPGKTALVDSKESNHEVGKVGRLVVASMALAITVARNESS